MANDLSKHTRILSGQPGILSAASRQSWDVLRPSPRHQTLVPKFKVWHEAELEEAVKAGSIFVTTDHSGRAVMFTLAEPIPAGERLNVNLIDQNTADTPGFDHTISTDAIVHVIGP